MPNSADRRFRDLWLAVVAALIAGLVAVSVLESPAARGTTASGEFRWEDWSEGPAMNVARRDHTVTLLSVPQSQTTLTTQSGCGPCRKVLVVGGRNVDDAPTGSVELYDPVARAWSVLPSLKVPRSGHSATLLPGSYSNGASSSLRDLVIVAGGITTGGLPTNTTEVFDPRTGVWSDGPNLNKSRWGHTATAFRTTITDVNTRTIFKILVVGGNTAGFGAPESPTRITEILEPEGSPDKTKLTGEGGSPDNAKIPPYWAMADPTSKPRLGHTTNFRLHSGEGGNYVVVIGGSGDNTVEAFNAKTGKWTTESVAGTTVRARRGHTATMLGESKILLLGGTSDGTPIGESTTAAEIYTVPTFANPGTSVVERGLAAARAGHTATALSATTFDQGADRAVLVLGGNAAASGEIIDDNGSRPAGGSARSGFGHASLLLGDGHSVLMTGGAGIDGRATGAVNLFDKSVPMRLAAPMKVARAHHSAALLRDGRVLVAGGSAAGVTMGTSVQVATDTAEVYSAGTDQWLPTAPMSHPRVMHTSTELTGPACRGAVAAVAAYCGDVMVAGGYSDGMAPGASPTSTLEVYRPSPAGRWELQQRMASTRAEHTATLLDGPECRGPGEDFPDYCGRVLLIGGFGLDPRSDANDGEAARGHRAVKTVELYNPANGEVVEVAPLPAPRARHAATLLADGRVAVIGGLSKKSDPTSSTATVDIYDPKDSAQPWRAGPDMPLCEVGKSGPADLGTPCQKSARVTATLLPDSRVLVFTGREGTGDRWAQIFDPGEADGAGEWRATTSPGGNLSRDFHAAALLPRSGRVMASAGTTSNDTTVPAFVYDIDESGWTTATGATGVLQGETMTVLRDSSVLIAGGKALSTLRDRVTRHQGIFSPGRPRGVSVSSSGSGSTVSWEPAGADGGAPILRYVIRARSQTSGAVTHDVEVDSLGAGSHFFEEVSPATHTFEVRAVNRIGEGQPGLLTIAAPVPAPPTDLQAVARDGAVSLHWARPAEPANSLVDGSAVTGYMIQVEPSPPNSGPFMSVDGADATSAEFGGLRNGTSYTFTVRATSSNGLGRRSLPSPAVTPGLISSAPTITGVVGRDRSAVVTWSPPADPEAPVVSYLVMADPGGASLRLARDATLALLPGLTNGTAYRFRVLASNVAGESPGSAWSETATPSVDSVPSFPTPARVPAGAPVVNAVTSRGGPVSGGPEVIITGVGFSTARRVSFGDSSTDVFTVISDHQLAVNLPANKSAGTTGRVTVTVANHLGTSGSTDGEAPNAWFHYGYGGWTRTGALGGRAGVPAMLPDGRAIAVESRSSGEPATSRASIYDPAVGLWGPTAPAAADPKGTARPVSTVTTAGKILAFRSYDLLGTSARAECVGNPIYISPNQTGDVRLACTDPNFPQMYGPATQKWEDIEKKVTAANGPAAVLEDGRVLVAGGCCQDGTAASAALASAEVFDPNLGRWLQVQELPLPLADHSLTVMSGTQGECGRNCSNVLAAGGFKRRILSNGVRFEEDNQQPLPPPAIFAPLTNTWRTTLPMNAPRYGHGAVELPGGKVMVVGGSVHVQGPVDPQPSTFPKLATATAEVFDPLKESWSYLAPMATRRYRPATSVLSDGRVLVAGGFSPTGPVADAEIYDPTTDKWSPAGAMATPGSAQLIELPRTGQCGSNCGRILAIRADGSVDTFVLPPTVTSLSDTTGPIGGGTPVTITGDRFTPESRVLFGGVPATSVVVEGPGKIVATSPRGALAKSSVTVMTDGGATDAPQKFTYTGAPGAVSLLRARALSPGEAELTFGAAGSVADADPAANRYVVKQSRSPITEANFDDAAALCGGTCDDFEPAKVGERLRLGVSGLTPGTRYHYAIKAVVDGASGPMVATVTDTPSVGVGRVGHLSARSLSAGSIQLSFGAAGAYESDPPPLGTYVVKQSTSPITDAASFDAATSLCGGRCRFEPGSVGETLRLAVSDLDPSTTYHYAVRADAGSRGLGPMSNVATITTAGPCAPTPPASPGQVTYPAGYSLVGLPSGTVTNAAALFGWFNLGSGNRYSVHDVDAGVQGGRGYWAYFACPTSLRLAEGADSADMALGRYRASMVGNPSSGPAELKGHDFAARWDPILNAGAGGYEISGYRQSLPLAAGEGAWAFSYGDTTLSVRVR